MLREHVLFYVNGRRIEARGDAVSTSLTDFLRLERQLTGVKVVCAEGDCGACTVLVGEPDGGDLKYRAVDACIQFLYQLDGKHIVTVEGLRTSSEPHPIQKAMVECYGSQCGYCTPGFVMALAARVEENRRDLRTDLTGNLCRCTGYVDILNAASRLEETPPPRLSELYPAEPIARDLSATLETPVRVESPRFRFFAPRTLDDAVRFKADHPSAVIVSGGTELGVIRNKLGIEPPIVMSLSRVSGLGAIETSETGVAIGANVVWTQVEDWSRDAVPEFHRIVARFGSPQIRNVATLVGNVVHGSPIADSLPYLLAMEAEVEVVSVRGRRRVGLNGFYTGYKTKDLAADEIVTHVRIPRPEAGEMLKLYKVSRRNDLDIATFGAAVRLNREKGRIIRARVAYSGVAATVVRLPKTEAFLAGQRFAEETFARAGDVARDEIAPITDVRGSRDFRWALAENILRKFYHDHAETEATP